MRRLCLLLICAPLVFAQAPANNNPQTPAQTPPALQQRPQPPQNTVEVPEGTHVLLRMVNSVSTRQAQVGDRLYLETAFPVFENGTIAIPQGSWVMGTITRVKKPERYKGKGELEVHFDSLTLPNGVTRSFRADIGGVDGDSKNTVDREHSAVTGPSDKGASAEKIAKGAATGAGLGTIVGASQGHPLSGLAYGSVLGAAAGGIAVLMSHGPDAMLEKGSTVELVLDHPLLYSNEELAGLSSTTGARR